MASLTTPHTLFSSLTVREKPSCDRDGLPSGDTSTAVMREGVANNGMGAGWGWGMCIKLARAICTLSMSMLVTPFNSTTNEWGHTSYTRYSEV